ncbi:MAG: hypothetical protein Q4G40_12585, partial [Brachybacterium sp.]|nr:hypothetical protein [Brachybacterium sp.]
LMMLCALLVVPGVRAWGRALHSGALGDWAASTGRGTARQVVVLLAVVLVGISLPTRYDQAALNARLDTPDRPRFLQADELAEFERVAPHMDRDAVLLASPYTGGAHQYGLTGQRVRFPVAGMFLTTEDRALIAAVPQAATDPASCALLRDAEVAYLYQDWDPYLYMQTYEVLNDAGEDLGEVLFETDHSRLIRVQCDAGD